MIRGMHHVGVAVRRIDDALPRYRAVGLHPEGVEEVPSEGVRIAFVDAGGSRIELLEPLTQDGVVARFLERRGEGLHHIAFGTDDLFREMERLRSEGFELIDRAPRVGARGRRVAFVHPKSAHGVLLEFVQE